MIMITGASAGIGMACAEIFAENGKDLLLTARRADRLEKLAARLEKDHGVTAHVAVLDVSKRESVDRFVAEHGSLLEKVTVLVNSAGLAKGAEPLQEGNPAEWDVVIDTNVKGLLYVTRALLPYFLKRNQGHIVNLGSVAGRIVYPKGNVYCASKYAVRAINEALRIDLNGTPIRVTEISPGMVETEFSVVRFGDERKAKAVYAGMTPLTARDIAECVAWCVARPRHVNIQELVIYPTDQASPTIVKRSP